MDIHVTFSEHDQDRVFEATHSGNPADALAAVQHITTLIQAARADASGATDDHDDYEPPGYFWDDPVRRRGLAAARAAHPAGGGVPARDCYHSPLCYGPCADHG